MNRQRPLLDTRNVSIFMTNVLGIDPCTSAQNAKLCVRIRDVEQLLSVYYKANTIKTPDFRDPRYYEDSARKRLHERIINELFSEERPEVDDEVRLGKGGLLPKGPILKEKKFFLLTGLPASGKSGIANKIADGSGSIIVDSDFAKRKFPEFKTDYGAALVHDEAGLITEGPIADESYRGLSVLEMAVSQNFNIVMSKICPVETRAIAILKYFKAREYTCYLVHVELSREKATMRAFDRFVKSKRYIPLALIYDAYANDPTNAYHRAKRSAFLEGFIHLSTDVERGRPPRLVEGGGCEEVYQWLTLEVHQ